MKVIPVFRGGKFIQYSLPEPCDALWSKEHKLQAASIYASALQKGYKEEMSRNIAEMMVNKQVYPNIQYDETWEKIFKSLVI